MAANCFSDHADANSMPQQPGHMDADCCGSGCRAPIELQDTKPGSGGLGQWLGVSLIRLKVGEAGHWLQMAFSTTHIASTGNSERSTK